MNHFYVITNMGKDKTLEVTHRIQTYIESKGRTCALAVEESLPPQTECILVLGGDGTLIRAAREFYDCNVPLVGINMGTLGYLTEVEIQNLEESLDYLFQEEHIVENRMMLKGTLNGMSTHYALNDIVMTRRGILRVIHFEVYVNGELLNTYEADGVIVATPTGSTAYNLSAGGPIVEPTAELIVITPICSHALNTSSIVLSAEDEIQIVISRGRENSVEQAEISFDGDEGIEIRTGDRLQICKAQASTKLLKINKISFLETLRRKMKGN